MIPAIRLPRETLDAILLADDLAREADAAEHNYREPGLFAPATR